MPDYLDNLDSKLDVPTVQQSRRRPIHHLELAAVALTTINPVRSIMYQALEQLKPGL